MHPASPCNVMFIEPKVKVELLSLDGTAFSETRTVVILTPSEAAHPEFDTRKPLVHSIGSVFN